jgi:hypothetical protein
MARQQGGEGDPKEAALASSGAGRPDPGPAARRPQAHRRGLGVSGGPGHRHRHRPGPLRRRREGFQHLVAEVSLGRAGILLGPGVLPVGPQQRRARPARRGSGGNPRTDAFAGE